MTAPSSSPQVPSAQASNSIWGRPLTLGLLAGIVFLTLFFRLGGYGLIDADEGRYASIPLEMLNRGDWVTPMLNGAEFFDKPVLLYWSEMLLFSTVGATEFAARLAPALFALAAIVATYALSRRTFGARAAFLSAAILSTTLMWPVLGRTVITDTPLASLTTVALCFWWLGHTEKGEINESSSGDGETYSKPKRKMLWFALFWASLGLGILSKGPVAVVLCFGAIIPYLLWSRPRGGWQMGALWGVPLMVLVAAPWFVLVQLRNPEFNHLFWWEQNFARFMGSKGVPDHWEPPYFFLPLLPVILFPWSVFVPRALTRIKSVFRRARLDAGVAPVQWREERARAVVFLTFGSLFVLLFFSASKSKIVTYIAPLVPLVCVMLGAYFDAHWKRGNVRIEAGVLAVLALIGAIASFVFAPRAPSKLGLESATAWLFVLGIVLLVWAGALLLSCFRKNTKWIFGTTAGGFAVFLAVAVSFWCALAPTMTTAPLLSQIKPALTPQSKIASVGFIQSLSFYTGRRVAVDGVLGGRDGSEISKIPDELLPAWKSMAADERNLYFYGGYSGLKRLMVGTEPVFVFARQSRMRQKGWKDIKESSHILAENERYVVVGNDAAWERVQQVKVTP